MGVRQAAVPGVAVIVQALPFQCSMIGWYPLVWLK